MKSALLSSVREQNKVFYGMVIAQAQKVEVDDRSVVFTFAPVHKALKTQLEAKRAWIEQLAHNVTGKKLSVVTREAEPSPASAAPANDHAAAKRADLHARAKAEPAVQTVLDVFGGEISEVEEIE